MVCLSDKDQTKFSRSCSLSLWYNCTLMPHYRPLSEASEGYVFSLCVCSQGGGGWGGSQGPIFFWGGPGGSQGPIFFWGGSAPPPPPRKFFWNFFFEKEIFFFWKFFFFFENFLCFFFFFWKFFFFGKMATQKMATQIWRHKMATEKWQHTVGGTQSGGAGGTPLAVTQEDCLVYISAKAKRKFSLIFGATECKHTTGKSMYLIQAMSLS